jgi:hypothetical protein
MATLAQPPRYIRPAGGKGNVDYTDRLKQRRQPRPAAHDYHPVGHERRRRRYGDVEGEDGVAEIAIGRIPALTEGRVARLHRQTPWPTKAAPRAVGASASSWSPTNPTTAGDFTSDSEGIAQRHHPAVLGGPRLPGMGRRLATRSRLLDGFRQGSLLVNYIGHSAVTFIGKDYSYLKADIPSLTNGDRQPLFSAMTCNVGRFEVPGQIGLSEQLVLRSGGAIASYSPTGLSLNADAVRINQHLMDVLLRDGERVLGDAVLEAQRRYGAEPHRRFMQEMYGIFGDPAVRLH